jgi:hypothetical protein
MVSGLPNALLILVHCAQLIYMAAALRRKSKYLFTTICTKHCTGLS